MTIKQAFQKLALSLSASLKNPFFVNKRLYNDFATIADEIEESGEVDASDVSYGDETVEDALDTLNEGHVYSTTEKIVGKWIDDSDLYEKTITDSVNLAANTEKTIGSIESAGVIISMNGIVLENGTSYSIPEGSVRIKFEEGNLIFRTTASSWNGTVVVNVRYTKVTT